MKLNHGTSRAKNAAVALFANTFLAFTGAFAALVLFYFVYVYAWTHQRQFYSSLAGFASYSFFAASSVLLFSSLKMCHSRKVILSVTLLSSITASYGIEILLARADSNEIRNQPFWSVDVVNNFRRQGVDAVQAVMLGGIVANDYRGVKFNDFIASRNGLMPIGGIARKLTVLCNESGEIITYTSDEYGFRNPPGLWQFDHADVAVLGESAAQGYCVRDGKNFVDLIRERYPRTLDLGISGESTLLKLAAVKEYLPKLAPRIVLWVFSEGIDSFDLASEANHPLLRQYLEPNFTQRLTARQHEIDGVLTRFLASTETPVPAPPNKELLGEPVAEVVKLSTVRQSLGLTVNRSQGETTIAEMKDRETFRQSLLSAKSVIKAWGGTLYFVYLPSWNRYAGDTTVPEVEHENILKLVSDLGIRIIDVEPTFSADKDPKALFTSSLGHYTENGNTLIAETILHSSAILHSRRTLTTTYPAGRAEREAPTSINVTKPN